VSTLSVRESSHAAGWSAAVEPVGVAKCIRPQNPKLKWLLLNSEYAKVWPNITVKKAPPPDYKEWEGKPNKLHNSYQIPAQVIETDSTGRGNGAETRGKQ
jgi:hypothetical protein